MLVLTCNLRWWCFSFHQLAQIYSTCTCSSHDSLQLALAGGAVFPSSHWCKYSTCSRATCTVWWWLPRWFRWLYPQLVHIIIHPTCTCGGPIYRILHCACVVHDSGVYVQCKAMFQNAITGKPALWTGSPASLSHKHTHTHTHHHHHHYHHHHHHHHHTAHNTNLMLQHSYKYAKQAGTINACNKP